MTLILDYSTARPDPAAIKAAGYAGVMRYLAPDNALTHGKILYKPEADSLLTAGLTIGLVWEWFAGRAAQGFTAGVLDCHNAELMANGLGYAPLLPINYAVDFGAGVPAILPYFQGICSVATRPVGVYGSFGVMTGILDSGEAVMGWQTCGWSGLEVSPRASLYQRLHATVPSPLANTDENVMIHPFPMWGGSASPVVIHPPTPTPVPPVFRQPPPAWVPVLKLGSRGAAVRALQLALNHVFPAYSNLVPDGIYGPATFAVVRDFQIRMHIGVDGMVGPVTRAALRQNGIIV